MAELPAVRRIESLLPPEEAPTGKTAPFAPDSGTAPLLPGYEILDEAGRGGMGVVFKARNLALNRIEAIKTTHAGFATPQDLARFRFEAEAAARLDHPNIVSVYSVGEASGTPYLALAWMAGGSLAARKPSSPREIATLMAKVARAVHHAHQRGILHRDLKPGNILLDEKGEPHVADFGIARRMEADATMTRAGGPIGTPAYMSPEQARGDSALTFASDVYSLGAVLYKLLTGRLPYQGTVAEVLAKSQSAEVPLEPRRVRPGVDADLEAVCLKCLEKDSQDRYASAAALADDLDRYIREEGVSAQPPGLWDWLRQVVRTRPQTAPDHAWWALATMGGIRLAAHLAIFGFVLADAAVSWVWLALSLHWAALLLLLGKQLASFRRLKVTSRHSLMISLGHVFGTMVLALAYIPLSPTRMAWEALGVYPALGAAHGLVFFVLGSTHWSRLYVLGLGVLALVPVMALYPGVAPLLHGASYAACMWHWAYSLKVTFGTRP